MFLADFKQNITIYPYDDISGAFVLGHVRALRTDGIYDDLVTSTKKYLTHVYSLYDVAQMASDFITNNFKGKPYITGFCDIILINDQSDVKTNIVLYGGLNSSPNEKLKADFTVHFTGSKDVVDTFEKYFADQFKKNAQVQWYYLSRNHVESVSLNLSNDQTIHDEFYPWFKEGAKTYFKNYLDAASPILFISGEPGVGKTSFLRAMIIEFNLSTYVGYDPKLLSSDGMFIDFIVNGTSDLLILEDAETLVLPRKAENNTLIARLLNVSDGIIRLPNKKIIFTTNEAGFNHVDEALLRPGRCYDSVEFRSLKYDEAVLAAKKANLSIPTVEKEYTLAKLFNQKQKVKQHRVGF